MTTRADGHLRLFLALWPPPPLATALASLARDLAATTGGRATPRERLHLTLLFLGDQPAAQLPALQAVVAGSLSRLAPCVLTLDRMGAWPRQSLIWAGTQAVPSGLGEWARGLRSTLENAGFSLPSAPDFHPHVTLVRRARTLPEPGRALDLPHWSVGECALIASTLAPEGPVYRQLGTWPATGDVQGDGSGP